MTQVERMARMLDRGAEPTVIRWLLGLSAAQYERLYPFARADRIARGTLVVTDYRI